MAAGIANTQDLLEKMVQSRQLSASDAEMLAQQSKQHGRNGSMSEDEVLRWLAKEYDLEYTALDDVEWDRQLLSLFPTRILCKEQLLPLKRVNGTVEVATSHLFSPQGLDTLKTLTGLKLRPVLAPTDAIQREIKKRLGVGADTIDSLEEENPLQVLVESEQEDTDLDKAAEDASIIRFVNQILKDAIDLRASDVHLEPFEGRAAGAVSHRRRAAGSARAAAVEEIPAGDCVARQDRQPFEHRREAPAAGRPHQDPDQRVRGGHSRFDHPDAPRRGGGVLRLLRQDSSLLNMNDLGMAKREFDLFQGILELPHGIVLVTGPTGSGKTTTLYTALHEINDSVRKIITIEDPIEYQMKGVNQIQVSEKAGLTFARGVALDFASRPGRGADR